MLIPKKMSTKKILQYGLIMSFTLGATGYLIFKNFIAPGFSDQSNNGNNVPVINDSPLIEDPLAAGNEPALNGSDNDFLFDDEKFKKLKDNMNVNIDSGADSENIGKKNPFEAPKKAIDEVQRPAENTGQTPDIPATPATTSDQQFISL